MLKAILVLITKVLESKLVRSGLEATILKNQNYITEAKNIWNMVNENFRISETVEEKLKSKADEFDKALLTKFPELTKDDITNLRQSIAGEINAGKEAVISNSDLLKQLQESNNQLQSENSTLRDQLSKVQSLVTISATVENTTNIVQDVATNPVVQA
jgi:regulator of replication initiation timing